MSLIRQGAASLWTSLILVSSTTAVLQTGLLDRNGEATRGQERSELLKLPTVSVPKLQDGEVKGYVVVKLSATVVGMDPGARVDAYIVDEAFRSLWERPLLELQGSEKGRLESLTKQVIERVNARLAKGKLRDLLVQEWAWVAKQDARQ